jgi:prevent-host-death family protein
MTVAAKHLRVGVRELKNGLSAYLAAVREGGEVLVTDHGEPIARIVPLTGSSEQRLAELVARGEARPPELDDRWLPEPVEPAPGTAVSDLLREPGP